MQEDGAMSVERRIEVLAKSALFQNLPTIVLTELAARGSERKLQRGQILFSANEPADGMYVVLSGSVRAFRENMDGREQTIHVERRRHAGGSNRLRSRTVPLLHHGGRRLRDAFPGKRRCAPFMLKHPEMALTALAMMAKKLRTVATLAEQLALKDVSQRLATLLIEEAQRSVPKLQDGVSFSLPLSHTQLAARLGSVREVVTRSLQKLVQQEVLAIHGHRIVILDLEALRTMTENHHQS